MGPSKRSNLGGEGHIFVRDVKIRSTTGMKITKLTLQNFRNFNKKQFDFSELTTVIVGANATGKTNILEAIYLLSTGKSFHAGQEEEMIRNGDEIARVAGEIIPMGINSQININEKTNLETVLTRGTLNGTKISRKKLSVNGVSKRLYNFVGNLRAVLFGPWDLGLVTESPSSRRRFLDFVLSQVDREYRRSLLSYEKGLRQRNRVLERIKEGEATRSQLLFWDKLIIKNGNYITQKRQEFIDFVNSTEGFAEESFELEYDKSTISEGRLTQYAEEEVRACATLVGPHRDDIVFKISTTGSTSITGTTGRNLAVYGSRGEQRMGVLWLKLAELEFIRNMTRTHPIMLLDDIFSELDHKHHEIVIGVVGKQQTIITTADPHNIEGWRVRAQVIEL